MKNNKSKRIKLPWMELTQSEIDSLDEKTWQNYLDGQCLCFAFCECECICGSWHRHK